MHHSLREKVATAIDIVYRTNYLRRTSGSLHQPSHAGQKIVRWQRLQTELHVQSFVLRLSVFQSADDHDWQHGVRPAKLPDKLRAVHARHNVVGDDQINLRSEPAALKLFKCLSGVECRNRRVSRTSQNRLPGSCLHCIVIDKKDSYRHSGLLLQGEKSNKSRSVSPHFVRSTRKGKLQTRCRST